MKTQAEALEIFLNRVPTSAYPGSEWVSVPEAKGRVTAAPVHARLSSPRFHAAAMDGFAIRAKDSYGAGPDTPVSFEIGRNAWPINTGQPIMEGVDAVVMIENVHFTTDSEFQIEKALVPWENVRRVGEDFVASEMILPARHQITAYDLGALLAAGVTHVEVVERPLVWLIPTGSELVEPEEFSDRSDSRWKSIEFNTVMLAGLVHDHGGIAVRKPIVKDEYDLIKAAIREAIASKAHIVVINAGSSAGSEDYTAAAIREMGELLVHGVAMMPGKPTILGVIDGKPIIGNPGYPVSSVLSFELFGAPLLRRMQGLPGWSRPTVSAVTTRKVSSKLGREEFFRVKLGKVRDRIIAAPLPRGAGSITTLTRADGIIRIPLRSEGIDQAAVVTVELLRDPRDIDKTIVSIGSHDLMLDILDDELRRRNLFLSSSHVGSLGGLLALKKGNAHVATAHLLDPETGVYNWSYIEKYIPEMKVRMFHGAMREQGFIVAKNNPKGIREFHDLAREDVRFINRQAGAGTRVLLDYCLQQRGIDPEHIQGYELEEYTHTSVAVAVLSGVADVGMGILAAAQALGLDFIPVATEEYDLVIPEEFVDFPAIQTLLETLRSQSFKERVQRLGGYGVEKTGEEIPKP
jgi:putative molybdopterin biosynthesis protein